MNTLAWKILILLLFIFYCMARCKSHHHKKKKKKKKDRNVTRARNGPSILSALHLTHRDFCYMRSGQFLKGAKPYSILCPLVKASCKPNILPNVPLLKVSVRIPNVIFSGLKYTLRSGTESTFDSKNRFGCKRKK